jgi:hypothetical protein
MNHLRLIFLILCLPIFLQSKENPSLKTHYPLRNDPIDVVFVTHPKDKETLEYAIDGILENCKEVRRVIVVSPEKLTNKAEWFDEKKFPFNKKSLIKILAKGDKTRLAQLTDDKMRHNGSWYFQQLLKVYAPFVIPNISSNVLLVDADTIFMKPVQFLNSSYGGLFCLNYLPREPNHFEHAKRLVPGYKRHRPKGVCHHMLFQRPILEDLFKTVENHHKVPFWKAFCLCVEFPFSKNTEQGASEYVIYYDFALSHTDQVSTRDLKWIESGYFDKKDEFKKQGYHFVTFHSYKQGIGPI